MDARQYIQVLESLKGSFAPLMCSYCGTETQSIGSTCMCSNCELIVSGTRGALTKRDHVLVDSLDRINNSIEGGEYEDALAVYENLLKQSSDPALMYAAAAAYLKQSNYETSQISYSKEGFMEDNTVHRNNGAKLASAAKKYLARAISTVQDDIVKGNRSFDLVYNMFLAQVKMDNMRAAQECLNMLKNLGNSYVYDYASMVFESALGRYDRLANASGKLMAKDNFSINAFYYAGFALLKSKKLEDSKELLHSLAGMLRNPNIDALIAEIDYELSTSR